MVTRAILRNDVTTGYPELTAFAVTVGDNAVVLDGEIVAFDDRGGASFEWLQSRMHARNLSRALVARVPVLYVIFDLLWVDGRLLTREPLVERRRELQALQLKGGNWQTSPFYPASPTTTCSSRAATSGSRAT